MRELEVTPEFRRRFKKLPQDIRHRTSDLIEVLRADVNDRRLDTKKLQGYSAPPLFRLRIGNFRLVYSFNRTTLTLHTVMDRKDVYRDR